MTLNIGDTVTVKDGLFRDSSGTIAAIGKHSEAPHREIYQVSLVGVGNHSFFPENLIDRYGKDETERLLADKIDAQSFQRSYGTWMGATNLMIVRLEHSLLQFMVSYPGTPDGSVDRLKLRFKEFLTNWEYQGKVANRLTEICDFTHDYIGKDMIIGRCMMLGKTAENLPARLAVLTGIDAAVWSDLSGDWRNEI